jgi:hypothetical protein
MCPFTRGASQFLAVRDEWGRARASRAAVDALVNRAERASALVSARARHISRLLGCKKLRCARSHELFL